MVIRNAGPSVSILQQLVMQLLLNVQQQFCSFFRTLNYNLLYSVILRHKTASTEAKNAPNCSEQSVTRADNVFVAIFTIFRMPSIIELLCCSSRAQFR